MAESFERTYVIPLRREWMKVPGYKRARKGVVAVKEFIARHMRVPGRDLDKVKVDVYLNNEMWFRGSGNSPSKIKVKAVKNGEIVNVSLAEIPEHVKFAQQKHARYHKKAEKKQAVEEKKEEKTQEEKKEEEEKSKSAAIVNEKLAEQQAKTQKHTTKVKTPEVHRMALKK